MEKAGHDDNGKNKLIIQIMKLIWGHQLIQKTRRAKKFNENSSPILAWRNRKNDVKAGDISSVVQIHCLSQLTKEKNWEENINSVLSLREVTIKIKYF